jgi:hypothetical protein
MSYPAYNLNRRRSNPLHEDLRLKEVLNGMGLKYEWLSTAWDEEGITRKGTKGQWHMFAAKVSLSSGHGYIDFWGTWCPRAIPFRNPNFYQKQLKARKIAYCARNNIPLLYLERHLDRPAFELFVRRWLVKIRRGEIAVYEPKQVKSRSTNKAIKWELNEG